MTLTVTITVTVISTIDISITFVIAIKECWSCIGSSEELLVSVVCSPTAEVEHRVAL